MTCCGGIYFPSLQLRIVVAFAFAFAFLFFIFLEEQIMYAVPLLSSMDHWEAVLAAFHALFYSWFLSLVDVSKGARAVAQGHTHTPLDLS